MYLLFPFQSKKLDCWFIVNAQLSFSENSPSWQTNKTIEKTNKNGTHSQTSRANSIKWHDFKFILSFEPILTCSFIHSLHILAILIPIITALDASVKIKYLVHLCEVFLHDVGRRLFYISDLFCFQIMVDVLQLWAKFFKQGLFQLFLLFDWRWWGRKIC